MSEQQINLERPGYDDVLKAAGYTVIAYEKFGDYQGTWFAYVEAVNGGRGFIIDRFGSCSGCDSLRREFDWDFDELPLDERLSKLRAYGEVHYDATAIRPYEEAMRCARENDDWDTESAVMVAWLESLAANEEARKEAA